MKHIDRNNSSFIKYYHLIESIGVKRYKNEISYINLKEQIAYEMALRIWYEEEYEMFNTRINAAKNEILDLNEEINELKNKILELKNELSVVKENNE